MGRDRKNAPGPASGDHAKERHKRDRKGNLIDWTAPLPPGLVARPERPRISSKHKSWFEFIENKDKKKKLEFEFTEKREPPPGFEFVPIGNPALTTACKELSREQGAMIFIVTSSHGYFSKRLSLHLNRAGHHIRQTIVEQARASLGEDHLVVDSPAPGQPEPIPERQEDINKQADAAIRDLFPRIPNTDRQMIIEHAFNKVGRRPPYSCRPNDPTGIAEKDHSLTPGLQSRLNKGDPPVGLASHLTLSRRVQLAVLAHIRHTHTRYDQLLKETSYVNARKAVESLCLDFLVKWRGDEETGRDQLDEILCEVIVISDSESDESDDDEDENESSPVSSGDEIPPRNTVGQDASSRTTLLPTDSASAPLAADNPPVPRVLRASHAPQKVQKASSRDKRAAKWAQRGFSRYQAAWHQAVERQRLENDGPEQSSLSVAVDGSGHREPQPWRTGEPERWDPGPMVVRNPVDPPSTGRHRSVGVSIPPLDGHYEQRGRADDLLQAIPPVGYRVQQNPRVHSDLSRNGVRSRVGSRPPANTEPELERVRYQGQDLKDYLVPSIEPASPEPPRFIRELPPPAHHLDHYNTRDVEVTRRVVSLPRGPAAPAGDLAAAEMFHRTCAEEGFVRLPPRSERNRISMMPSSRSDPLVSVNPQPVSRPRGSPIPVTRAAPISQQRPAYYEDQVLRDGELLSRPDWTWEDGATLGSETRPLFTRDQPPRYSREPEPNPAYASLENDCYSPKRGPGDVRPVGHGWVDEPDKRLTQTSIDQRVHSLQGDFVEIVRVSNKFPRQHEPRSAPSDTGRYELRPSALRQQLPQLPDDDTARYDSRQLPAHAPRVDRALDSVDQPYIRRGDVPYVGPPVAINRDFPRQERVVGIEYFQARPR
ncbi:hypothetical protein VTK26DRAFT_1189 [Humicola hyalothermophila]